MKVAKIRKIEGIMMCERMQEFISADNYEAAHIVSAALTETLRKMAQGEYETIPVDNETGSSE